MLVLEQFFPSTLLLTLSGRFDQKNDMDLEKALLRGEDKGVQHVVFNLEQISTIDTAGIGRLYLTFFSLKHKGVCLSLVNPKPTVRMILELVEIPKVIQIFESNEAAIAWQTSSVKSSPSPVSSHAWDVIPGQKISDRPTWAPKSPTETSA